MTSTSGAGHVGPLLPFAAAVRRAGGKVLVASSGAGAARARAAALAVYEVDQAPDGRRAPFFAAARRQPEGNVNSTVVERVFAGLDAQAALPGVLEVCRRWQPDVIVHESCEFAAVLAAELTGVPRVRVAIGTGATENTILQAASQAVQVRRGELGLGSDLGGSGLRAVLAFTLCPAALEQPGEPGPPATRRFRQDGAGSGPLPDLWPGDERPLVYLTFGSVAPNTELFPATYRTAIDALAALPVRVLVALGHADAARLGPLPPAVRALPWVAQTSVLAHAAAVACHGGSGTLQPALAAGIPLALLPLFADQPHNARCVEALGAGIALWDGPRCAHDLGRAVAQLLGDPKYRAAAQAVAADVRALPPPAAAVTILHRLTSR